MRPEGIKTLKRDQIKVCGEGGGLAKGRARAHGKALGKEACSC